MSKIKIYTVNGFYHTGIKVYPKNWKTKNANVKKNWRIFCDFYDPAGNLFEIRIKGMNHIHNLQERQKSTEQIVDDLREDLESRGYNPFDGTFMMDEYRDLEINPHSSFSDALDFAFKLKNDVAPSTVSDLKMVIDNIKVVAKNMNIHKTPIEDIKLKHIKLLLTAIGRNSAHKFNKFRSYLGILFNELREIEVTTLNICAGISKSKGIKRIRQTLTQEQRIEVANHLKAKNYPFYRFAMIFYHSGCREEELLRLKVKDINIERQEMKVLVKKGRLYRETMRAIKAAALPFWEELELHKYDADAYVFSYGLIPGLKDKPIRYEQITRRWRDWVKKPLNIEADFYSLKHSHTDDIESLIGIEAAAKHNETSTRVAEIHYAVGMKGRELERMKKMNNTFT